MKPYFYTLLLIVLSTCALKAQTIQITDTKGAPLEAALVLYFPNGEHSHTNPLGQFTLENESFDSIQITYLGYKPTFISRKEIEDGLTQIKMNETVINIEEILVEPSPTAATNISNIQLKTSPTTNAQEQLRFAPGLAIGQHAGGGKAEQIFYRGFDIDHGTDLAISVDGLPVNMVSHAHGQGYADLHFLIPELTERIHFQPGSYDAEVGNFATAGSVEFELKDRLDYNNITLSAGQFNTKRLSSAIQLLDQKEHSLFVAGDVLSSDGPFESSQNFNRFNALAKYKGQLSKNEYIEVLASHFTSNWDASGQIPVRAVESGLISRFGAIDDTEGGETSRSNIALSHSKAISNATFIKSRVYYTKYDFELFSNFTFFLEDPENGDQIRQYEDRNIVGIESKIQHDTHLGAYAVALSAGAGLRYDQVKDNTLSHTLNRTTTLNTIQYGDINETNYYAFAKAEIDFNKLIISPGLRVDNFIFDYQDYNNTYDRNSQTKSIVSPKLSFFYNHNRKLQSYLKLGKGFHSNDTRVVLEGYTENIIPASYGYDAGLIWKPWPNMFVQANYWQMYLEQEFVYVGDAGIVEPSGETMRQGIEINSQVQLTDWLFFNGDIAFTKARAINEAEGEDYIPLAPDFLAKAKLSAILPSGLYGSLSYRFMDDRPANEDNSIVAEGYQIFDMSLGYELNKIEFGVNIQNLLDAEWNETQFATESRLSDELESVEEIHFTPGTSFSAQAFVRYKF